MANLKISQLTADASPTTDDLIATVTDPGGTPASRKVTLLDVMKVIAPKVIGFAVTDQATPIVAGTGLITIRVPYAMTLTAVRASLKTAASSGTFSIDINEGGTTILSTKLTIDATEKTSTTAATPAVISDTALADDAEITVDVDDDAAGDAVGLIVWLIGY